MHIRLGYAAINTYLRDKHIFTNRTARLHTIKLKGIKYAKELFKKNLKDMLTILQWNELHGIEFYRMSSSIAPHITNPELLSKKDQKDYKKLAFSLEPFRNLLQEIGQYAKDYGHRLTFHPDPFISLGSSNPDVVLRNTRELYFHARILDMMNLNMNSIIVIHGGGVYNNKEVTIKRWANNFNNLPVRIKRRLVLENDEFSYSTQNVLKMSSLVNPYNVPDFKQSVKYKIPIVFDVFHYYCYNRTTARNNLANQKTISELLPLIIRSWSNRQIKMHISEQRCDARFGSHSDYVNNIPIELLTFPKKFNKNLDLMVEAKMKEKSVKKLKNKYKICI